jgi:protein-tyrosine-phosphatase
MAPRGRPSAILFACTMNAVRSPLAAGLARAILGKATFVRSAGVRRGETDGFAVEVAREAGIDLSHHEAHTFDDLQDHFFDVVVALSPEADAFAREWTRMTDCEVEFWPMPDPTSVEGSRDARLAAYRELREQLRQRITDRFAS